MSSWLEYDDMSLAQWSGVAHRKRVKKMAKLFEDSQESIRLARSLESQDRLQAITAFREMIANRKFSNSRKDIALYCREKKANNRVGGRYEYL